MPRARPAAAILNLFSSFGYHDDATCADIIKRFARALRPGGRLVLETIHVISLVQRFQGTFIKRVEDDLMIDENTYDPVSGRTHTRRTTIIEGRRTEAEFFVRLFTMPEFTAMCAAAGLEIERICDGFTGKPLTMHGRRLLFVARRPETELP